MTGGPRNDELAARVHEWRPDLVSALRGLYTERADAVADELVARAFASHGARRADLVELDRRRLAEPDWYLQPERVGYMAYVDRFGGDLRGVRGRIPYLRELGVDVLHLLSLLRPREGENDGGYAVRDYRVPDPRHGTPADLDALIDDLRAAGISLCVDFVLNHTSDDHEWAVAARAGSEYHRDLFLTFPDRTVPDAYEATLPEVFPQLSPGNFTWVDAMDRWVWTTFRDFQWDLDWSNPDVMIEIADIAFHLANLGVEILRLDAIAFTWKRLGTSCQNQPEAHLVAQALRAALAIAAPATILLAEAIVGPNDLVGYLGRHELERRECELGYHNQLMVQGWGMLAARRADLARVALQRLPDPPPTASWFTYVRCHDDIGWAIDDADAAAIGVTGAGHREFLAAFYRGDFWKSFARGTPFGTNPETNDERTSGMAADLAGVAAGIEQDDPVAIDLGVRRLLLLYAIAFGYGGIPIVYMGDELCQGDDRSYLEDAARAGDTRWCHRPVFDDALAVRRTDPDTLAGRLWAGIRHLVDVRRGCLPLHGATSSHPFDVGHPAVFAWHRHHPRFGDLVGLANVGDTTLVARLPDWLTPAPAGELVDRLDPASTQPLRVEPLRVRWLTTADGYGTVPRPG
jgi:amylosucrase